MFSPAFEMSYAQSPAHTVIAQTLDMCTIAPRIGGSLREHVRDRGARDQERAAQVGGDDVVELLDVPVGYVVPLGRVDAGVGHERVEPAERLAQRCDYRVGALRRRDVPEGRERLAARGSDLLGGLLGPFSVTPAARRPARPRRRTGSATSRPMPLDAPVTSARLPERRLPLETNDCAILSGESGRGQGNAPRRRGHADGTTTRPASPEAVIATASLISSSAKRWVTSGASSSTPATASRASCGMCRAGTPPPRFEPRTVCSNWVAAIHVEPRLAPHRRLADQHGRAAVADAGEGLLGDLGPAQGLERVVDAVAVDDRADLFGRVAVAGIDHVRSAELDGELALERRSDRRR